MPTSPTTLVVVYVSRMSSMRPPSWSRSITVRPVGDLESQLQVAAVRVHDVDRHLDAGHSSGLCDLDDAADAAVVVVRNEHVGAHLRGDALPRVLAALERHRLTCSRNSANDKARVCAIPLSRRGLRGMGKSGARNVSEEVSDIAAVDVAL